MFQVLIFLSLKTFSKKEKNSKKNHGEEIAKKREKKSIYKLNPLKFSNHKTIFLLLKL